MTTITKVMLPDNSTDANFRLWGGGVSAALAALGLVKTADSGQINWASVSKPASSNTYAGYEIWTFPADANQTAAPIFFKIEYGSGASQAYPSMRFQFGQGSDGAGTLTGYLSNASSAPGLLTLSMSSSSTTIYVPWHFSYNDGIFTMVTGCIAGVSNYGTVLCISRLMDSTGAPKSNGWFFQGMAAAGTTTALTGCWRPAYGSWALSPQGMMGVWPFNTGVTSRSGGKVLVGPTLLPSGLSDEPMERTLGVVYVSSIDFREGDLFPVRRWDGKIHYYKVSPTVYAYSSTFLAVLCE